MTRVLLDPDLTGLVVEYRESSRPRPWCVVGSAFGTVIETYETELEAVAYQQRAELEARGAKEGAGHG